MILTVVLSIVDDLGVEKIACVADPIGLRQSFCKICVLLDVCVNQSRIGTESLYWPPLTIARYSSYATSLAGNWWVHAVSCRLA